MMTLRYALKHVLVRRLRSSNSNYHDHSCDAFDKEKSAHRCVFAQARDIVLVYLAIETCRDVCLHQIGKSWLMEQIDGNNDRRIVNLRLVCNR